MPALGRIILYVKDVEQSASFYTAHFGFEAKREAGDRIVELVHPQGGAALLLHPTARSQKTSQSTVKLVFDVGDVEGFVAQSKLKFGTIHRANGYSFANAKDVDGNSVQVSGRGMRSAT
jgi:catechol 2,3-dioxygenase-like lactoylglutathione lyase family enzyme